MIFNQKSFDNLNKFLNNYIDCIKNNGPIRKFLQIFDLRPLSCSTPRGPSAVWGKSFKSDQSGRYEFLKKKFTEGSMGEKKFQKFI